MSLDKAIEHGKEHRKAYHGAEAVDRSCRPHGGGHRWQCEWCLGNRMYKHLKKKEKADLEEKEYQETE